MNSSRRQVHSSTQLISFCSRIQCVLHPEGGVSQKRMKAYGVGVEYKRTYYLCGKYEKHVLYLATFSSFFNKILKSSSDFLMKISSRVEPKYKK